MTTSFTPSPPAAASRALVVVPAQEAGPGYERPLAAFLTQMIASNRRLRAYRRAGRSDAGEATRIYGGRTERPSTGIDLSV